MLKIGIKYCAYWNFGIEYISSEISIPSDVRLKLASNLDNDPLFNWSFPDFSLTAFVCHALSKTSSSFRQPSAVCCALIITDKK